MYGSFSPLEVCTYTQTQTLFRRMSKPKGWSVHDGQNFATNVWSNTPRAPNEKKFLDEVNHSPTSVLVDSSKFEKRNVASMWLERLSPGNKVCDNSTQTPALSTSSEKALMELEIRESVRKSNGDAPPKLRAPRRNRVHLESVLSLQADCSNQSSPGAE